MSVQVKHAGLDGLSLSVLRSSGVVVGLVLNTSHSLVREDALPFIGADSFSTLEVLLRHGLGRRQQRPARRLAGMGDMRFMIGQRIRDVVRDF